mgnify:FL=1
MVLLSSGIKAQLTYETVFKTTSDALCNKLVHIDGALEYYFGFNSLTGKARLDVFDHDKKELSNVVKVDSIFSIVAVSFHETPNKFLMITEGLRFTIYEVEKTTFNIIGHVKGGRYAHSNICASDNAMAFSRQEPGVNKYEFYEYQFKDKTLSLIDSADNIRFFNYRIDYLDNQLLILKDDGLFTYDKGSFQKLLSLSKPIMYHKFEMGGKLLLSIREHRYGAMQLLVTDGTVKGSFIHDISYAGRNPRFAYAQEEIRGRIKAFAYKDTTTIPNAGRSVFEYDMDNDSLIEVQENIHWSPETIVPVKNDVFLKLGYDKYKKGTQVRRKGSPMLFTRGKSDSTDMKPDPKNTRIDFHYKGLRLYTADHDDYIRSEEDFGTRLQYFKLNYTTKAIEPVLPIIDIHRIDTVQQGDTVAVKSTLFAAVCNEHTVKNEFFFVVKPEGSDTFYYNRIVDNHNSIATEVSAAQIDVYPNPSKGWVKVKSTSHINSIRLIDMQGRALRGFDDPGNSATLNLSEVEKGSYILSIHTKDGVAHSNILLKK